MPAYDVAIIGAGIVGLSTARALAEANPSLGVTVLEKEPGLAMHQTGRNSGVVHAGLYYTPGSLKARLCVEGGRALVAFCERRDIPVRRCGKVVVATDESQLDALAGLEHRATANGVPTSRITPDELREREPHASGVAALHVPETSVVDFGVVANVYAGDAAEGGVDIRTNAGVVAASARPSGHLLETMAGPVEARVVINTAGLHVDRVAALMGHTTDIKIVPFRGEYYELRSEQADLVRALIYPVPDPRFPFLGVHYTRDVNDRVEVGPNAVLAFAREGYRRRDVDWGDLWDSVSYRGLRSLARSYWKTGAAEMWRSVVTRAFVKDAKRLLPDLTADDLGDFRSGIRAQALRPDGSMLQDFAIEETANAIHVLNAPSPAATASLAIGAHIAGLAAQRL